MSPFMSSGPDSPLNTFFLYLMYAFVGGYVVYRVVLALAMRRYLLALPAHFRQINEVWMWVFAIPGTAPILNFIVFPKLAKSYTDLFQHLKQDGIEELKHLNVIAWSYGVIYLIPAIVLFVPALQNIILSMPYGLSLVFLTDLLPLALFLAKMQVLSERVKLASN